jgi:phage terminase small subunit
MAFRTPTAILEAKGAFIGKPSRQRPYEPIVTRAIGAPPDYLTDPERKVWKELVKQAPPGVLKYSDRLLFSVLVSLAAKFQARETMMVMETQQMIAISSKFGLSPADRAKIQVAPPKKSGLSAFLAKNKKQPQVPASEIPA